MIDFIGNQPNDPPEKRTENICLMNALFHAVDNAGKADSSAMTIIHPHLDSQLGKLDRMKAYRAFNHFCKG
jgi:hypothetical protein